MPEEDLAHLVAHLAECLANKPINDLPPLFDVRTLTLEEMEAYRACLARSYCGALTREC